MDVQTALKTIISLVPNWYTAETGTYRHSINVSEEEVVFYSHRRLTPELRELRERV